MNVAPLQLGEEVVVFVFHFEAARSYAAGTIFSANASKRGRRATI